MKRIVLGGFCLFFLSACSSNGTLSSLDSAFNSENFNHVTANPYNLKTAKGGNGKGGGKGSGNGGTTGGDTGSSTSGDTGGTTSGDTGGTTGGDTTGGDPGSGALLWSDPTTWGGSLPAAGEQVSIPAGTHILLDVNPPALAGLNVQGTLEFAEQDLNLTTDWILVQGLLQIGTETQPFIHRAILTLTGSPDQDAMGMGSSRGLVVMGGQLELHGTPPQIPWTKIQGHLLAGGSQLIASEDLEAAGWRAGDTIVISPTDFYGVSQTESFTISSINGTQLNLNGVLQGFRWGLMQYVTSAGMSLNPDGSVTPPAPPEQGDTPLSLDERAEVGNLSRNIVIQGADDEYWLNQGFGAHVMVMDLNSVVHVNGLEVRRGGQSGRLGRYPFHWHRLSYDDGGNLLGDVSGHYVRSSSFHDSANRCITLHATNGVSLENNICFDIRGHGIFLEDAVERRNTITGNLVLRVRNPATAQALKLHELNNQSGLETGSSGIWASNPDNTVRNNTFADCEGFGLWMAFPAQPVGLSANVPIIPYRLTFGNFDYNTSHSNQGRGIMLDNAEVDNLGTVAAIQYASNQGMNLAYPYDYLQNFVMHGMTVWKNGGGNFWNRVVWPTYSEWVSADSEGKYFAGSGALGLITRTLLVGESLNNFIPRPHPWMGPPTALATYHSTYDMRENIIVNFPIVEGLMSGAFATDDYYLRGVEKGHIRNDENLLIQSHPGHRSDAGIDEEIAFNFAGGFSYYVFAGALWDPHGIWGEAGYWNVYNRPFLTHGANCTLLEPSSENTASCDGTYLGVDAFVLDQLNMPWDDLMAIHVTRFADDNPDAVVDTWEVTGAQPGWALGHMRHFAAHARGHYLLDFPESPVPTDVSVDISNSHASSDYIVLAIRFLGTEEAQVYSSTYSYPHYFSDTHADSASFNIKHNYVELASRQAVLDSAGETYWQDHENNLVWVKVVAGGIEQFEAPPLLGDPALSDQALYNKFHLRVH